MENEIKIARPFERWEFKLAISDPSENYAVPTMIKRKK